MRAVFFLIFLLTLAFAKTGLSQSDYVKGVEALQNGEYDRASSLLQQRLDSTISAAAFYNLALALREQNKIGEATWAALSADALGGVGESTTLIRALQQQVPVELRPLSRSPFQAAWRSLSKALSVNVWALLSLICVVIGSSMSLPTLTKRYGWIVPALAFGAAVLAFGLGKTQASFSADNRAVVLKSSSLFVSPAEGADRQKALPVGTILRLGEKLNAYYAVKIPTGESGWVPSSNVRRVLSKD